MNEWQIIANALVEDVKDGDKTSLAIIPKGATSTAKVFFKDEGILAGVEFAKKLIAFTDTQMETEIFFNDGDFLKKGDVVMSLHGNTRNLLKIERLLLNVMQRMSGIATTTYYAVQEIKHTKAKLLDTRKTTPLLRILEKQAVKIGGGTNHRFGLFDAVMIKDNHIKFAGSLRKALESTRRYLDEKHLEIPVIVEVKNKEELGVALEFPWITRILLDNMTPAELRECVALTQGKIPLEASGGINMTNLREVAETGVDYISVGFITHSYKAKDISMKIV